MPERDGREQGRWEGRAARGPAEKDWRVVCEFVGWVRHMLLSARRHHLGHDVFPDRLCSLRRR
eukprot:2905115-Prymnesium_polylepis.1